MDETNKELETTDVLINGVINGKFKTGFYALPSPNDDVSAEITEDLRRAVREVWDERLRRSLQFPNHTCTNIGRGIQFEPEIPTPRPLPFSYYSWVYGGTCAVNPQPEPEKPTVIGDTTCRFNARSRYIRCAVNPSGDCKECPHYKK